MAKYGSYHPRPESFLNISRSSFMKIFTRSNSSEDLRWISSEKLLKIFKRKDFKKIWIKTVSSKNLQKVYINFFEKIFKLFLPKFFLRSLKDLQFKPFWDLWKISSSNLLEIFERSSIKIFLRSSGLYIFGVDSKKIFVRSHKIWVLGIAKNLKILYSGKP